DTPPTGLGGVVGERPDVDHPPDAADVHPGQVRLVREELHHLTWYAEAHVITPSLASRRLIACRARLPHQVHHHPGRLVHRRGDRFAETDPLRHAGRLTAHHQHLAGLGA